MTDARIPAAFRPSAMTYAQFMARLGGIYEHSPWVAEALWPEAPSGAYDEPCSLAGAMRAAVDAAPREKKLVLIRAHPELAGRAAVAGDMAEASKREQAGAGLDHCSPEEYAAFQALNAAYTEKFGFPFIVAVKGLTRRDILERFEARLHNDAQTEFEEAMTQIHAIARFRIEALAAEAKEKSR